MFRTYYRVYRDSYAGYEVRAWRWWWPFWVQVGFSNTHDSEQKAVEWLRDSMKFRDIRPEELR